MKILAVVILMCGLGTVDVQAQCFGRSRVSVSTFNGFGSQVNVNVGRRGFFQRFRNRNNVQIQVVPAASTFVVPQAFQTISTFSAPVVLSSGFTGFSSFYGSDIGSTAARTRSLAAELSELRSAVQQLGPPVQALSQ